MLNLHFSDRRDYFDDQGKVDTHTVIDISPLFKRYHQGLSADAVAYPLPRISRIGTNYMLTAPSFLDFQNNCVFEYSSNSNSRSFGVGLLSARRFYSHFLLNNFIAYSDTGLYDSVNIIYIHSPTLSFKVTPLLYGQGEFGNPRIQVEKSLDSDINVRADTDGEQYNASMYFSGKTKQSMNTNIDFSFKNNLEVQVEFDFYLSQYCRFVIHINQSFISSTTQLGLSYGIITNLTEDTKVMLFSHVSTQNMFQIKITSGKYNVKIPIICSTLHWSQFQILKLSTIVGFYFCSKLFRYYRRNDSVKKQMQKAKSSSRLKADESKLAVTIAEIRLQEIENLKFQVLSKGLVILAAYVGNQRNINKIAKRIKRKNLKFDINHVSRIRGEFEFTLEQVTNVTQLVQVLVKGARIENKLLKVYNPCFDEEERPKLYICYNLRGETKKLIQSVDKEINIGLPNKSRQNIITKIVTWLRKVNIIF